jgi:hypothetical protein
LALVGKGSNNNAGGATTLDLTAGYNSTVGDVLIAFIVVKNSAVAGTLPTGWFSQGTVVVNSNTSYAVYTYVVTAGNGFTSSQVWSWTWGGGVSKKAAGFFYAYSGVDSSGGNTTSLFDVALNLQALTPNPITLSLTTVTNNDVVVNGMGNGQGGLTLTLPTGVVDEIGTGLQQSTGGGGTSNVAALIGDETVAVASTFNRSFNYSAWLNPACFLAAFKPAAAPAAHFDQFLSKPRVNTLLRM